ncbi:MAG: hypothetical protein HZB38_01900 [Planctomycetes bacterium]|nr:hypothetical protein [Planctomycetota bacterium]
MDEILRQAFSLGISGLLFVMWWHERRERLGSTAGLDTCGRDKATLTDMTTNLVSVIRNNTDVLAALREELRAHRQAEGQWMGMLMERVERLGE